MLSPTNGTVQSMRFPNDYSIGLTTDCLILITAPPGKKIKLTFTTFIVEQDYDTVTASWFILIQIWLGCMVVFSKWHFVSFSRFTTEYLRLERWYHQFSPVTPFPQRIRLSRLTKWQLISWRIQIIIMFRPVRSLLDGRRHSRWYNPNP